ncbi:hypothetical protein ElyMa_004746200 [Elysia marginata]|uniref:Uncharacterized protein n=1 Tax=Elysia marginata TaxID=1093978 RepID=A0AAV4IDR6_9GAST|nr:hypothetical protein ElyMa_004746200 [Elysia marginata]
MFLTLSCIIYKAGWKVFRGSAKIRGSVSYELRPATARLATAVVLILCKNRGQTPLKTAVRKTKVRGFDIATGSSFLLFCVASVAKISVMHRAYTQLSSDGIGNIGVSKHGTFS